MSVLLGASQTLGNAAQLGLIAGASTSQTQGREAGAPNGAGFPFLSPYGMQRGPTMMLEGVSGQTAMGQTQRSEEGGQEASNQLQPLEFRIWMRSTSSEPLWTGVVLFACDTVGALRANSPKVDAYPLWAVQHEFERSARDNVAMQLGQAGGATPTVRQDGARASTQRPRQQRAVHVDAISVVHERRFDPRDQTLNQCFDGVALDNWKYAGVVHKVAADSRPGEAIVHVARQQHIKMPNLWGLVEIGSKVGFALKWVDSGFYPVFYNDEGREAGAPTSSKFLQLVPYVVEHGRSPPHLSASSRHEAPLQSDLDSMVPCMVTQELNLVDDSGRPTFELSSQPQHANLRFAYQRYDFGHAFFVGTVTHVSKIPSQDMCRRALRSPEIYKLLCGAEYSIDVQLGVGAGI